MPQEGPSQSFTKKKEESHANCRGIGSHCSDDRSLFLFERSLEWSRNHLRKKIDGYKKGQIKKSRENSPKTSRKAGFHRFKRYEKEVNRHKLSKCDKISKL